MRQEHARLRLKTSEGRLPSGGRPLPDSSATGSKCAGDVSAPPEDLKRGDIVAFHTPPEARIKCGAGGVFIQRIIGLPGDRLEVRLIKGNGYVFIDGRKLNEPYIQLDRRAPSSPYPASGGVFTVPKSEYSMMGDNRARSCDSRFWGTVPAPNIIGKVVKIVRPL